MKKAEIDINDVYAAFENIRIAEKAGLKKRIADRLRIIAVFEPKSVEIALKHSEPGETASFFLGQLIGKKIYIPKAKNPDLILRAGSSLFH